MLLGSEGILGVITEAWVRVRQRPSVQGLRRRSRFDDFAAGARGGARALAVGAVPVQLPPARPGRGRASPAPGPPGNALLVLGFESADHPVDDPWTAIARSSTRREPGEAQSAARRPGPRRADAAPPSGRGPGRRLAPGLPRAPPTCATPSSPAACSRDTFETAITWERFPEFHAEVDGDGAARESPRPAARRRGPRLAAVSCRFTHVYPDGPAPYFTVLAPARRGDEVEQWDEIKAAVVGGGDRRRAARSPTTTPSAATTAPGTTASAPTRSRPRCAAAKGALDPRGILNPGVLIDP